MKSLCLFTESFPFGNLDDWLNDEIIFLSKKFQHIYIYPLNYTGKQSFELPANVTVIKFDFYSPYNRLKLIVSDLSFILSIYFCELKNSNHKLNYITDFFINLNFLLQKINCAKELYKNLVVNQIELKSAVFYSYWFNCWMETLCILKGQSKIDKLVTRAHGGDLYEERRKQSGGYFRFRSFMMKQLNYVLPISGFGSEYLKTRYPDYSNKVLTSRLGVFDRGLNELNTTFTIVSCSALVPLKRVHLIVEILKNIKFNIIWYHLGGGAEYERIAKLINKLPPNIDAKLLGHLKIEDVYGFYKSHSVNLFINVSETEGIPVSIMEAISYGIPVIATKVGGTEEIVNNENGYLIDKEFDCERSANIIAELYENKNKQITLSRNARQFWNEHYNAENNYNAFTDIIKEL